MNQRVYCFSCRQASQYHWDHKLDKILIVSLPFPSNINKHPQTTWIKKSLLCKELSSNGLIQLRSREGYARPPSFPSLSPSTKNGSDAATANLSGDRANGDVMKRLSGREVEIALGEARESVADLPEGLLSRKLIRESWWLCVCQDLARTFVAARKKSQRGTAWRRKRSRRRRLVEIQMEVKEKQEGEEEEKNENVQ